MIYFRLNYPTVSTSTAERIRWLTDDDRKLIGNYSDLFLNFPLNYFSYSHLFFNTFEVWNYLLDKTLLNTIF